MRIKATLEVPGPVTLAAPGAEVPSSGVCIRDRALFIDGVERGVVACIPTRIDVERIVTATQIDCILDMKP